MAKAKTETLTPLRVENQTRAVGFGANAILWLVVTALVTQTAPGALAYCATLVVGAIFTWFQTLVIPPSRELDRLGPGRAPERFEPWPPDRAALTERRTIGRQAVRCLVVAVLWFGLLPMVDLHEHALGGLYFAAISAGPAIASAIAWRRTAALEQLYEVRLYRVRWGRNSPLYARPLGERGATPSVAAGAGAERIDAPPRPRRG